jgi:hypothetical protein
MEQDQVAGQHRWRFFRSGGFDQVALETGDDLRHLDQLDPKLWTVLNCPTTGIEFDPRTAALLDGDGDGQIRVPEVLAAVRWACQRLKDPAVLFAGDGLLPASIAQDDAENARLATAAGQLAQLLGKAPGEALTVADFADMTRLFPADHCNGDGVVTAALAAGEGLEQLVADIVATQGGVADRSGEPGVDATTVADFFSQASAVLAWHATAAREAATIQPLGAATGAAAALLDSLAGKVDDYFARCRLAAFDGRAAAALNPPEAVYGRLGGRLIDAADEEVAGLPLAAIAAGQGLPLAGGVNPAWAEAIDRLRTEVVTPLLGQRVVLAAEEWHGLRARFAGWRAWQAARPDTAVHGIDPQRLQALAAGDAQARLVALIERDQAAETSALTIDALERLVRYQRDLVPLLRNFVSLSDFYRGQGKAIFQAGTLYLDQRSCELVLQVEDMGRHGTLAPFSGCYLVYCSCQRPGAAPITIVAALTGGSVDELMVPGRNGVFYDRAGRDWKATVIKVVEQPVSLRQAVWAPYRRLGRLVESQLQKFAATRDQQVETGTSEGLTRAAASTGSGAAASTPFDIARFAGIFAAIGLAIGAIGTALAALGAALLALPAWQVPLVLLGLLTLVSGPSVLMAYLTLRRRNLGPLLDANGWAVNARARINVPFGAALTGLASLPAGAERSLIDPWAVRRRPWKSLLGLLAVLLVLAVLAWLQLRAV